MQRFMQSEAARLNPQAKAEALQARLWQAWLLSLGANNRAEEAKSLHDLLLALGKNAWRCELARYFQAHKAEFSRSLGAEPLTRGRTESRAELANFYTVMAGSELGCLLWQLAADAELSESAVNNWLAAVAEHRRKINKGRKPKQQASSCQADPAYLAVYYRCQASYLAKPLKKNQRHVVSLADLLQSLLTSLEARFADKNQLASLVLAKLQAAGEQSRACLEQAMADYRCQVQKASSLERSLEQLRQAEKSYVKLIKLYLLALKFGAENSASYGAKNNETEESLCQNQM